MPRSQFEESYSRYVIDHILSRFRIVTIIDIIFILGFNIVDRIAYHPYAWLFLKIRCVVCALLFILFLMSFTGKAKPLIVWLVDCMGLIIVAGIALMIFLADGSSSRYYEGLNLVIINIGVINSFYVTHNMVSFLLWLGINDAAMLFGGGHFNPVNFCYANAFMFTTGFLVVLLTKFYRDQHYQAFIRQEQLKLNMEEIREAKKEVERSNKELEQFAYVASHDLQEPLRMVGSFCQKLEKKYKDKLDQDANEYINFAVDGAKRMKALIDALLSYARVGKKELEIKPVDLNKVLGTILHDLEMVTKEKHATIKVGSLPVVMADEIQMTQLFQNFLTNALKFKGEKDPVIEVSGRREGNGWEFKVSDNGIGIDEKHFPKIFEIFQRVHERGAYPGTGIGLALCKKIIENFNGKVWVSSKVGQGTTFYFTLDVKET